MATPAAVTAAVVFIAVSFIIIMMSPAAPVAEAAEKEDHACGCTSYSPGCVDCDAGRCCSEWGYCGISFGYCEKCYCSGMTCNPCHCLGNCPRHRQLPSALPLATPAAGYYDSSNETLVATYDPNLDNVAVATSSSSSSSVGSATICSGPSSSSTTVSTNIVPGDCLQVTNPKNGKQAMVRIMNRKYCSWISLALDHDAFQQLEDDDVAATHLPVPVGYKYTHCVDN